MISRIFLTLALAYLTILLALFFFQRQLLFQPSQNRLSEAQANALGVEFFPSPTEFQAYLAPAQTQPARGTVIVFHGNAASADYRLFYAAALTKRGYRTLLAEYPGYGGRSGSPSEQTLIRDAIRTVERVHNHWGGPLYLWGESLGSAVVAGVLGQGTTPIAGAILMLPWDSLADLAQRHYWYVPARWLLRDRFDSQSYLVDYDGPVAVVLAGKDRIIPTSHGMNLYESLQTRKQLWVFEGAGHNSVPVDAALDWWDQVLEFIRNDAAIANESG